MVDKVNERVYTYMTTASRYFDGLSACRALKPHAGIVSTVGGIHGRAHALQLRQWLGLQLQWWCTCMSHWDLCVDMSSSVMTPQQRDMTSVPEGAAHAVLAAWCHAMHACMPCAALYCTG